MNLWIRHPRSGEPDAMLTMAVISVLSVLLRFVVSGLTLSMAGKSISLGALDGGTVAAILTPTLGAYVARKYSSPPVKT